MGLLRGARSEGGAGSKAHTLSARATAAVGRATAGGDVPTLPKLRGTYGFIRSMGTTSGTDAGLREPVGEAVTAADRAPVRGGEADPPDRGGDVDETDADRLHGSAR